MIKQAEMVSSVHCTNLDTTELAFKKTCKIQIFPLSKQGNCVPQSIHVLVVADL